MRWPTRQRLHIRTQRTASPVPAGVVHAGREALRALRVGDRVDVPGSSAPVSSRWEFEEAGYRWVEFGLDTEVRSWLCVEDTDGFFEVSLFRELDAAAPVIGTGGDDTIATGGITYRLQERGTASYSAAKVDGTTTRGACEYADYRSADRHLLCCEDFGRGWFVSVGVLLQPQDVRVRPAR